jgi:hypothetical protein
VAGVCESGEPDVLHRHALVSLGAAREDARFMGGFSAFWLGGGDWGK